MKMIRSIVPSYLLVYLPDTPSKDFTSNRPHSRPDSANDGNSHRIRHKSEQSKRSNSGSSLSRLRKTISDPTRCDAKQSFQDSKTE